MDSARSVILGERRLLGRALAIGLMVVVAGAPTARAAAPTFSSPTRLGFAAGDDWEPAIAAETTATDGQGHVYALWTHYGADPACPGCGSPHAELQVSSDGGQTWTAPRPLRPTSTRQDDPQIVVTGPTVYAAFMENKKSSEYVLRSDDFGASWTTVLVEPLQRGMDKDILVAQGQDVYVAFHAGMKIFVSASHDGGETWSLERPIANTNSKVGYSLTSGGAIDSRGTIYFAWEGYLQNGKAASAANLYLTKSTDGGATWTTMPVAFSEAILACDCGGWNYWGPQMALAVDGSDRVYVLYNATSTPSGVGRVLFTSSGDGGSTWAPPQDVSGAPAGSNNVFPAMVARGDGDVRIAWMDDRNGHDAGGNDPNARWNTWYRASTNGGFTWSTERSLSQYAPDYAYSFGGSQPGYLQPYGDYFELDIDGAGRTHVIWGEGNSYAGPGNVWYTQSSMP
jgi:hypothetical protein